MRRSQACCRLNPQSQSFRKDRLLPVRPDGDHFHRPAQQLAEPVEILPGIGRQIADAADVADLLLPAGQRLVDRHHPAKIVHVAGKIGGPLAVQFVGGANLQFRQLAQNVQQHHRQHVDAAEAGGIAGGHGVEPAAAPGPPRDRAVLVPPAADVLARLVVLLGGERSAADPRGIGLDDADDLGDVSTGHARAGRNAHARAVAAGDEGEGAVVDVQQRALGALEEHPLVGLDRVEQIGRGVGHVRAEPLGIAAILVENLLRIEPIAARAEAVEDFVLRLGDQLDPAAEIRAVHVAQPDGQRAAHLVAVAGSDAAHGGADRLAAGTLLVQQPIFLDVPGEDHVRPIAQDQVPIHLDAAADESVDLGQQGGRDSAPRRRRSRTAPRAGRCRWAPTRA